MGRSGWRVAVGAGALLGLLAIVALIAVILLTSGSTVTPVCPAMATDLEMSPEAYRDYRDGR